MLTYLKKKKGSPEWMIYGGVPNLHAKDFCKGFAIPVGIVFAYEAELIGVIRSTFSAKIFG